MLLETWWGRSVLMVGAWVFRSLATFTWGRAQAQSQWASPLFEGEAWDLRVPSSGVGSGRNGFLGLKKCIQVWGREDPGGREMPNFIFLTTCSALALISHFVDQSLELLSGRSRWLPNCNVELITLGEIFTHSPRPTSFLLWASIKTLPAAAGHPSLPLWQSMASLLCHRPATISLLFARVAYIRLGDVSLSVIYMRLRFGASHTPSAQCCSWHWRGRCSTWLCWKVEK